MNPSELLPYKLSRQATKQLKAISKSDRKLLQKLDESIQAIRQDPSIGSRKKGDLEGYQSVDIHHLRTNYELCYTLEEDENGNKVLIVFLGPRENFYNELKRYLGI